jgi:hypothetical protein
MHLLLIVTCYVAAALALLSVGVIGVSMLTSPVETSSTETQRPKLVRRADRNPGEQQSADTARRSGLPLRARNQSRPRRHAGQLRAAGTEGSRVSVRIGPARATRILPRAGSSSGAAGRPRRASKRPLRLAPRSAQQSETRSRGGLTRSWRSFGLA